MDKETYEQHKGYAGETKPSMLRRRIGHDYSSRRMYLITMTIEGRRPLLGQLVGGEPDARVELSELGEAVKDEWMAVTAYHPEVEAVALQIMPDHLHGVLFVQRQMDGHLGEVIKGFKASTNKHYRRLVLNGGGTQTATASQQREPQGGAGTPAAMASRGSASAVACAATPSQQSEPQKEAQREAQKPQGEAQSGPQKPQGGTTAPGIPQPWRQPKRDRSKDNREHGLLWSLGYNDHILSGQGELQRWLDYLHDNPRRLLVKRQHPEYFRVRFGLQVGVQSFDAIGNQFLLNHPEKLQVQCSRSLTKEQMEERRDFFLSKARQGAVLVSPAISPGEKLVMRAALDARLPLIFLSAEGFTNYTKPGLQFYDACAEARLLILAPWGHDNRKKTITRDECLALNAMTQMICNYPNNH